MIDSHLHVWDPGLQRHAWLDDEGELGRPFLPGDVDFGAAGVTDVIFVQADAAASESVQEAAWVASLEWPERAGIVAHAPVDGSPVELSAVLDGFAGLPVVGIRRLLQDEPLDLFAAPELARGLAEIASRGLAFDACVRHPQLEALMGLVTAVPELTVVIDHLGKPPVAAGIDSDDGVHWRAAMAGLADRVNVNVKLSGIAPEADPHTALAPQARPFLDAVVELFGPDRCMVGSDWPVSAHTPHALSYSEWFALVLDESGLSAPERHSISVGTATRVYGIAPRE